MAATASSSNAEQSTYPPTASSPTAEQEPQPQESIQNNPQLQGEARRATLLQKSSEEQDAQSSGLFHDFVACFLP